MGVTPKMRLYNVYRICKQYVNVIAENNITTVDNKTYEHQNWNELQNTLSGKIPVLQKYTNEYIEAIPKFERKKKYLALVLIRSKK